MDEGGTETDEADNSQHQTRTSGRNHQYEPIHNKQQPGRVSSVICEV